jgi:hypothetical protein
MMICNMSYHWKYLYALKQARSKSALISVALGKRETIPGSTKCTIVAKWLYHEPVLCIDKALFILDALSCAMPATPPWKTLCLVRLSRWKREVEEVIKILRRSGFSNPLWRGRVRRPGCSLSGHAVRGGFFPP